MIMFARQLIAVPLRLIGWANAHLQVFNRLKLAEIIWLLAREPADGANVITLTAVLKDTDAARQRAEVIFSQMPHEQIAAAIGWLEVGQARDLSAGRRWVDRLRTEGAEDGYSILQLEMFLAEHLGDCDQADVIQRVLSRNDLPGAITQDALLGKSRMLLKEKRWEEAEAITDRILSIEESAAARWTRWVARLAAGDVESAESQLKLAGEKMRPEVLWGFVALGWLCIGDQERALEILRKCRRQGKDAAIIDRDLALFVHANEHRIAEG